MEQMKVVKIKYMEQGVYCILNLWSYSIWVVQIKFIERGGLQSNSED